MSIAATWNLPTKATEPLKARAEYQVEAGAELVLRVAQIPTTYNWVDRDIEGKVLPPKIGDVIVAQNFSDIDLGGGHRLPKGSKFHARVKGLVKPRFFQKDGHLDLEFFKLETSNFALELDEDKRVDISTKHEPSIKSKLKKTGVVGAYTLGGALAGAFITYKIGGIALVSNPYAIGGMGGLGATVGLASGIFKKGKLYNLEPGTELKLALDNPWILSLAERQEEYDANELPKLRAYNLSEDQVPSKQAPIELDVLKVKKSKNIFGRKALAITLNYQNLSDLELRTSSFKLFDSMGKQYEPSIRDNRNESFFNSLSKQGKLTLYYAVEFLKAPHILKVVRRFDQKPLATEEILLKK